MMQLSRNLPSELTYRLNQQHVKIQVMPSARSRRATLRYDLQSQGFKVRIPPHFNRKTVEQFLKEAHFWMETQLSKAPLIRHVHSCDKIMIMGNEIELCYHPSRRTSFLFNGCTLHLMSPTPHYGPLLEKWLRQMILEYLQVKSEKYSRILGAVVRKVNIREAQSRWGSCSAQGALSYNWRLIFAPQWVIDYVVAHEVSHLKEMNHSAKFWRLVTQLYPEAQKARHWLKQHGTELLALQFKV